jgi:phosphatidylethanolamine-binding protein (PEBP) family uncharacterized protein
MINPKNIMKTITTAVYFLSILICCSCNKKPDENNSLSEFILSSPAIGQDSLLPADYTCKGAGSTLPLRWQGVPSGTVSLALIMHHEASSTDIHCYWIIYDIPPETDSLQQNVKGIGIPGINSVNCKAEYTPPCSQGPGIRDYIFTLYALSEKPVMEVVADSVNRTVMLEAIKDITISSTKMKVYYVWPNQ